MTTQTEALAQPEQDGQCKRCTNGCPACDARKLPEHEPDYWLGYGLQAYTEKPFEGATPLYTKRQP